MRDVGILVWVVFLVIGVIGSMVSSMRRQLAAGAQARPQQAPPGQIPPQWKPPQTASSAPTAQQRLLDELQAQGRLGALPPAQQRFVQALWGSQPLRQSAPQPVPAPPAPTTKVEPPPLESHRTEPPHRPMPRFWRGPALVRAVIAAEVLGKPRALGSEYPWS